MSSGVGSGGAAVQEILADGCDAPAAGATRPLRADAQRNRVRILEAAEMVFAAEGIDAPVDRIAEKAGVGVGTLYRHFPTKERLCEAILLERLVQLTDDARALADAEDPTVAFFGFLESFAETATLKRDLLAAVMNASPDFHAAAEPVKEGLRQALGVLLVRAQECGSVRSDVTPDAVMALTGGACQGAAYSATTLPSDLLAIVCYGLRTQR